MTDERKRQAKGLFAGFRRFANLYIENARLTAAEKITLFLSAAAVAFIVLVLALAMFIFLAIGIANLLDSVIPTFLSYLLMAAIFLIAIVLVLIFRVQWIFNPIARFISHLLLPEPKITENEKE